MIFVNGCSVWIRRGSLRRRPTTQQISPFRNVRLRGGGLAKGDLGGRYRAEGREAVSDRHRGSPLRF